MRRCQTTPPHVDSGSSGWEFDETPFDGNRIGIALSGGGVRSAAFGLGAIQALQERGILRRSRFLSAVSGGSYVAAAYVSAARNSDRKALTAEFPQLWAPGSPEQVYLSKNLGYLARDLLGRVWFVSNFIYGAVMNLLPLLCGSFLAGRLLGLLYRVTHDGFSTGDVDRGQLFTYSAVPAGLVVLSLGVVLLRSFHISLWRRSEDLADRRHMMTSTVLALAALLLLALIVLPVVATWLNEALESLGLTDGPAEGADWLMSRIAAGAVMILIGVLLGLLALAFLGRKRGQALAVVLSTVGALTILLTPCLLALGTMATRGWSPTVDPIALGLAAAVLVLFGFVIHNRRYSMHNFYRERLCEAYFVTRKRSISGGKVRAVTEPVPFAERLLLSDCDWRRPDDRSVPELLIGAAVNATDRSISFGSGAAPFVFSPSQCGSEQLGWTKTCDLEPPFEDGGADLTLPAMVAISGAAISPVMGRLTVRSFRFLLALLNIRLGVWIPRPRQDGQERGPTSPERAVARLPARMQKLPTKAIAGWREPGAYYVLREGLGLTSLSGRFVYVTDGGHWENLGLYELVRRRCTHIFAFDATNNPKDGLADLSRCCQLLFSRLGVEIAIDPGDWAALAEHDGMSQSPVVVGEIRYPDAPPGRLVFARCALWPGVPPELVRHAAMDGRFPKHSTSNQFLTGDQFEAYRRLGWCVGDLAEKSMARHLIDERFDEGAQTASATRPRSRLTSVS
jgi:hypothetical protein